MRQPIGVFDSGIGGLTVVRELRRLLPHEDLVYYGDTARVPYGTKSPETIIRFSIENTIQLLRHGIKCLVVACNTSSSAAVPVLNRYFRIPVIGVIKPGAMAAVRQTRNKRVGVIGTEATVSSRVYEQEIKELDPKITVYSQSCPLFVSLVESGWTNSGSAEEIAGAYLKSLKAKRVDTLILGCTHYPLLAPAIEKVMQNGVRLVDSATQTALWTQALLGTERLLSAVRRRGRLRCLVTDEPEKFALAGRRFLGEAITSVERVREGL